MTEMYLGIERANPRKLERLLEMHEERCWGRAGAGVGFKTLQGLGLVLQKSFSSSSQVSQLGLEEKMHLSLRPKGKHLGASMKNWKTRTLRRGSRCPRDCAARVKI